METPPVQAVHDLRYARPEHERRFLLARMPGDVRRSVRITDHYLLGTHLRLRRIETLMGEVIQRKLAHKVRPEPDDPSFVLHTTMYLSLHEYETLARLPARELTKIRHLLDIGAAVDEHLDGTLILEVQFDTREAAHAYQPPDSVSREVTMDERYTGAGMAGL